jgi:DNA-binding CsgD family transcriptional regulator
VALTLDGQSDSLFELIDKISKADKLFDGQEILRSALSDFGLEHVAYAAVNLPTEKHNGALIAVTYSPDWQKHYLQQGYVDVDPAVRAGMGGILPVDWGGLDRQDPLIRKFFGEAQEFNVGRQGLSFPIRGKLREFALFSITSAMKDTEWAKVKQRYMREFMLLAYHFHSWALTAEAVDQTDYRDKLSRRETECLRWRALGKSDWETSQIMAISERTVKFHLENARAKLGAMNTIHAVSKALSLNLITLV